MWFPDNRSTWTYRRGIRPQTFLEWRYLGQDSHGLPYKCKISNKLNLKNVDGIVGLYGASLLNRGQKDQICCSQKKNLCTCCSLVFHLFPQRFLPKQPFCLQFTQNDSDNILQRWMEKDTEQRSSITCSNSHSRCPVFSHC